MKKSVLLWCSLLISTLAVAQVEWNVKGGLNLSNWTGDSHGDVRLGYKAGVGMEYHFTELWSYQSALFFTAKGVKNAKSYDGTGGEIDVNQLYIEMPMYGAMRFHATDFTDIVLSFGPYIACGVGGKIKGDYRVGDIVYPSEKVNTFGSDRLNRFDVGLGFGVATEINRLIIGLEAQLGLVKLMDYLDQPHNLNFSIMLGYKFWE